MQRFSLTKTIVSGEPATACEFLASHTVLSKSRIKDAMAKGAVWIKKTRGKQRRIRRATAALRAGDILSVNDDAGLLALAPLRPDLVSDQHRYSVWYKPAGLMTPGTRFGDHCSLLRQAELFFKSRRDVFPVHRLDREAARIVILAHDKKATAGSHSYTLSQFGLDPEQIRERFAAYIDSFGWG